MGDIFDPALPGEDRALFRLANRLHRKTRDGVIRRLLLFGPGDRYSRRLLDESERLLRETRYLYDAEIRPVRYHGDRVDVEVRTRDVWTLNLSVGFGRSGGTNRTRVGIADSNFLGTGKDVTLRRSSDVDRTSVLYRYRDDNLLGSRARLELAYTDNSDGTTRRFDLGRPFFALDTRWAAGVVALSDDRVDSLYDLGLVTDRFRHRRDLREVLGGASPGLAGGAVRRWTAGFTHERDRFEGVEGEAPPTVLPPDRTLAYPWIGFESILDRFVEIHDLDRLVRTEDRNLGRSVSARIGFSLSGLGADSNRAILRAEARTGFVPSTRQMLFVAARGSGRWGGGVVENGRLSASSRYYVRDLGGHVFYAGLEAGAVTRADPEDPLLLGGDSGLRGYPLRYQTGDRRVLLTLEQRFYTDWHVFELFHVGAAVFFDAGRAWRTGPAGPGDLGVLKDVGAGLRIGSSRSADAALVHLDVAVPLDRTMSIRSVQFLVESKETF